MRKVVYRLFLVTLFFAGSAAPIPPPHCHPNCPWIVPPQCGGNCPWLAPSTAQSTVSVVDDFVNWWEGIFGESRNA